MADITRVRLALVDPDGGRPRFFSTESGWVEVLGRVAARTADGFLLIELDDLLERASDLPRRVSEVLGDRSIRWLLLEPVTGAVPLAVGPNVILDQLAHGMEARAIIRLVTGSHVNVLPGDASKLTVLGPTLITDASRAHDPAKISPEQRFRRGRIMAVLFGAAAVVVTVLPTEDASQLERRTMWLLANCVAIVTILALVIAVPTLRRHFAARTNRRRLRSTETLPIGLPVVIALSALGSSLFDSVIGGLVFGVSVVAFAEPWLLVGFGQPANPTRHQRT
jgi:hypothetical protein